ncbi:polysaccharide deacetylase family protein [Frigidibacter sp. MR17.24]|uniref:polysaccharide deacetylase family protein n=1 Tax=Frigidibacter sp. MR17.24 TaxID=3127345 RepID=UPI003012D428
MQLHAADDTRVATWEQVFATEDPFGYSSAYEQVKYERTLELLPRGRIGRALELACAEGHFTMQLAGQVDALLAADISDQALARAAARCAGHDNVLYRQIDVARDAIPGGQDLITCSEFLYYLDGPETLAAVAAKIRDALAPGGVVVMANHFLLRDDPSRTGFDWDQAYGAKVIAEAFTATEGLVSDAVIETELYRVDRFRRSDPALPPPEIDHQRRELDHPLEPRVARHIVWNGAFARRREVEHHAARTVPVLTYHRIAAEGPPALAQWRVAPRMFRDQLRLLRRNGFRSTSTEELTRHAREGVPLSGRPVLITFDDGYLDFATEAWPILQAEDFRAEMFLVTDLIGTAASWDLAAGPPAPLMDWPEIRRLAEEGCTFLSHLATHAPATGLSSGALLDEAFRARTAIEARLGQSVTTLATPYGASDTRVRQLLQTAGYTACHSCLHGVAGIDGLGFEVPRIEVRGDWTLEDFARNLGLEI